MHYEGQPFNYLILQISDFVLFHKVLPRSPWIWRGHPSENYTV